MKDLTDGMKARLTGTLSAFCWIVRIQRKDGLTLGFTTHDEDLTIDGQLYKAQTAVMPSPVESRAAQSVDNLSLEGILHSEGLNEDELMLGLWDGSRLEVAVANPANPVDGKIVLSRAFLGEITLVDGSFKAEVRGMHELLQKTVGRWYLPTCTARLFDDQCKLNPASWVRTFTVKSGDRRGFILDGELPGEPGDELNQTGYYTFGWAKALTGANAGHMLEIKGDANVETDVFDVYERHLSFWMDWPFDFNPGDHIELYPGCDRNASTCTNKFGNIINHRGFPFIPGQDQMNRYPDSKYGL